MNNGCEGKTIKKMRQLPHTQITVSSEEVARDRNQDGALLKTLKYKSLKPTVFQKHRNDLAIMTSNSLNEAHRERHVHLLEAREGIHLEN